jgi:uncharacterized protein YodC (DUF2158 family)
VTLEKVEIGDVVRLKSGGPKMRIEALDGPAIYCAWSVIDEAPMGARFTAAMLEPAASITWRRAADYAGWVVLVIALGLAVLEWI